MKYIFTEDQFVTLLALSDISKLYAFQLDESISDEAMTTALNELYHMECITEQQGLFVLSEALTSMLAIMKRAECVVRLECPGSGGLQQLVYPGERGTIVVLEKGASLSGDFFKIQQTDADYYIRDLFENDVMPESRFDERREAEQMELAAPEEVPEQYREEDILLRVQRIDTGTGQAAGVIAVYWSLLFTCIHVNTDGGSYYHLYSVEELGSLLHGFLKGVQA